MRLGNILAGIGIVLCLIGLFCLPLYNLHELPFIGDASYPKGGGWIALAASGLFARLGIILMVIGGIFLLTSKILPKKYWETPESLLVKRVEAGRRNKRKHNPSLHSQGRSASGTNGDINS
jgi:hypothetical protein